MIAKGRHWLESFPALRRIADPVWRKVADTARIIAVDPGVPVFRERATCADYLLIVEGEVRVQKLTANGQVITLYHLQGGQSCELTTTCLLGGSCYPAEGIAETPVQAVLIPKAQFRQALAKSPQFGEFVFSSIDKGVNELITLLEEVAFGHMDRRLAYCLLQKAHAHDHLQATHHELSEELGTAREVVSRLLKEFERQGWVRLHRGRIEIHDHQSLQSLADKRLCD